jgi:hypothetical protein
MNAKATPATTTIAAAAAISAIVRPRREALGPVPPSSPMPSPSPDPSPATPSI